MLQATHVILSLSPSPSQGVSRACHPIMGCHFSQHMSHVRVLVTTIMSRLPRGLPLGTWPSRPSLRPLIVDQAVPMTHQELLQIRVIQLPQESQRIAPSGDFG